VRTTIQVVPGPDALNLNEVSVDAGPSAADARHAHHEENTGKSLSQQRVALDAAVEW
jgi:hypothetical protein